MLHPSLRPRLLARCVQIGLVGATLAAISAPAQAEENTTTTLDTVSVSSEVADTLPPEGTTEGTHAYTTGSASTATPFNMSLRETPQSVSVVTQQRM